MLKRCAEPYSKKPASEWLSQEYLPMSLANPRLFPNGTQTSESIREQTKTCSD